LARARSRARARGAVLVEAVIVIPVFIILFAGIVFFGKIYDAKLNMLRLTRQSAWTHAMANCGTAGDPATTTEPGNLDPAAEAEDPPGGASGQPDGVAGPLRDALRIVGDAPHKDVATNGYKATQSKTDTSVKADEPIGSITKQVSGASHVMCNEAPFDADRARVREAAMQTFRETVLSR
jgi:hypothetical protein